MYTARLCAGAHKDPRNTPEQHPFRDGAATAGGHLKRHNAATNHQSSIYAYCRYVGRDYRPRLGRNGLDTPSSIHHSIHSYHSFPCKIPFFSKTSRAKEGQLELEAADGEHWFMGPTIILLCTLPSLYST